MNHLKKLLAILPDDTTRDDLLATAARRERQYRDIGRRAAEVRQRIADLTEALADANAKERTALLKERRDLLAEQSALPLDATVAARLYAESLTALSEAVTATATTARKAVRAELDATQKDVARLERDLRHGQPGTAAYDRDYADFRKLTEQRAPAVERLAQLDALLATMHRYIKSALRSPESEQRPAGVKLTQDGRPRDAYITAFVSHASKAVAA